MNTPSTATLARLAEVVGRAHALTDPAAQAAYLTEWRGLWSGRSPMVLRPGSTGEVSRLLAIAHETGTVIVPRSRLAGAIVRSISGGACRWCGTQRRGGFLPACASFPRVCCT